VKRRGTPLSELGYRVMSARPITKPTREISKKTTRRKGKKEGEFQFDVKAVPLRGGPTKKRKSVDGTRGLYSTLQTGTGEKRTSGILARTAVRNCRGEKA